MLHAELDNLKDAEEHFRAALSLEPENGYIMSQLANILKRRKQFRDVIDLRFALVQLDPTNEAMIKALFNSINEWLESRSIKTSKEAALAKLPEMLQHFYRDYRQRASFFERYGVIAWIGLFAGILIVLTGFFSLVLDSFRSLGPQK